jgi:hypothetical protein
MEDTSPISGLVKIAAIGGFVKLPDGKEYRLGPLSFGDWGEFDARIITYRTDPFERAVAMLPKIPANLQEFAIRTAIECVGSSTRMVSEKERQNYFMSPEGACVSVWLAARKNHPEIDCLQKAEPIAEYMLKEGLLAFAAWLDKLIGIFSDMKNLGNLPGQSQTKAAAV